MFVLTYSVPGESPLNVFVESENSTSVRVQWNPPRQEVLFGILRSYRVRIAVTGQTNFSVIEVPSLVTVLLIGDLMEFTNYSVEVTAVTVGEGPYSDPVVVTTDQDSEFCTTSLMLILISWQDSNKTRECYLKLFTHF